MPELHQHSSFISTARLKRLACALKSFHYAVENVYSLSSENNYFENIHFGYITLPIHDMVTKKKILVVDDEVIIADDLCATLNNLGYDTPEPALSYAQAVDFLSTASVDLVILDINLGGKKSGIDVAEYIRQNCDTPFIFLSSHSDSKTLELAKNTMPYAYLVKPFVAADVMTSIEIAFNNQKRYLASAPPESPMNIPDFTGMEKVVLRKVAENLSTREIANALHISESTVKNHRHNICVKLNLPAGTHSLLKWVMENNHYIS